MVATESVVLIDADSIYFRASYKLKKNEVRKVIDDIMRDIEGKSFMATPRVAVKGKGNFRKDLYPAYKGNRNREYEEAHRAALNYGYEYMVEKYDGVPADGMEADDLVCIWAYEARELEIPYLIAGIDKDLKQIPGDHYNFGKQEFDHVTDDRANYNLMLQCLTGDSGDNIPGLRGIGPKKAAALLAGATSDSARWDIVRNAWGVDRYADLDISRRLLEMIRTWEEFDGIKAQCETIVSKQDVLQEQEQDSGVSPVSGGSEGRDDGSDVAVQQ